MRGALVAEIIAEEKARLQDSLLQREKQKIDSTGKGCTGCKE